MRRHCSHVESYSANAASRCPQGSVCARRQSTGQPPEARRAVCVCRDKAASRCPQGSVCAHTVHRTDSRKFPTLGLLFVCLGTHTWPCKPCSRPWPCKPCLAASSGQPPLNTQLWLIHWKGGGREQQAEQEAPWRSRTQGRTKATTVQAWEGERTGGSDLARTSAAGPKDACCSQVLRPSSRTLDAQGGGQWGWPGGQLGEALRAAGLCWWGQHYGTARKAAAWECKI